MVTAFPLQMQRQAMEFERQNEMASMQSEMMDDAFECLEGSEEEEEADAVTDAVFEELGLAAFDGVSVATGAVPAAVAAPAEAEDTADVDEMMSRLAALQQ